MEFDPSDFRIDTFKIRGSSGWFSNESGVRITHLPTGISVECEQSQSQHLNRNWCYNKIEKLLFEHSFYMVSPTKS